MSERVGHVVLPSVEGTAYASLTRRPISREERLRVASSIWYTTRYFPARRRSIPVAPKGKALSVGILGEGAHGRQHRTESLRVVHEVPRGQVNRWRFPIDLVGHSSRPRRRRTSA